MTLIKLQLMLINLHTLLIYSSEDNFNSTHEHVVAN